MAFDITEPTNTPTLEQKKFMAKRRIINLFKEMKERIQYFNTQLEEIVYSNMAGLTSQEVLSAFTTEQKQELNSIKTNLLAEANRIVKQ